MLHEDEIARLTSEMVDFIERHGIRFSRGDARAYYKYETRMHAGLTLPFVSPDQRSEIVRLKNLYALWNVVLDDEIDRTGARTNLDASLALLAGRSNCSLREAGTSDAATILAYLFARIPATQPRARDALRFDLWEVANGLVYEFYINTWREFATLSEYCRYSAMTASLKPYLDIDWMFSQATVDAETYKKLRLAYEHFSLALKYSSDIGTFRRELLEENNLNIVRIRAAEEGILRIDQAVAAEQYGEIARRMRSIFADVAKMADDNMSAARAILKGISALDTSSVVDTISHVIRTYTTGHDTYRDEQPCSIMDEEG